MGPAGKWIEGIDADASVEDAARRSLEARLTAVVHWLPLAAYLPEQDVEHVHRLRVSTRRAVAALTLYQDWLPSKPARWLKKRLKKIRRAAGDARDLDVLSARLAKEYGERAAPVVKLITERRAAVQPAIVDVAERSRRDDRFVRKTAKLIESIRSPAHKDRTPDAASNFRDWAAAQLATAANEFRAALPDETADLVALHQFRIRGKAMRYTIELLASAFGPELRKEQYRVVEDLQERLGRIQDHAAAGQRLGEWADKTEDAALQELLRELRAEEGSRVDEAVQEFREWWTPDRAESLTLFPRSAWEHTT